MQAHKDRATGAEMAVGQRCQHILAEWKKPKATCPNRTAGTASPLAHRAREGWQIARIRCPKRQRFEMWWETGRGFRSVQGPVRRSQGPTSTPSSQAATWPLCPYRRHIYSLEKETLKDSRLEDSRKEAENTDVNWGNSLIDGEIPTPFPAWFPDH